MLTDFKMTARANRLSSIYCVDVMTTVKPVISWDELVQDKLIDSGYFGGLCLISHHKQVIYTHGDLCKLSKSDIDELFISFYCKNTDKHYHSLSLDFSSIQSKKTSFRIYQRSPVSVNATAIGSRETLTISRLPTGLFVCLSHKSVLPNKAVSMIEEFTAILKS